MHFANWGGVVQYQFVVPQKEVFQKIVNVIKKEKLYSTLGVLKVFGKQPKHYGNLSLLRLWTEVTTVTTI